MKNILLIITGILFACILQAGNTDTIKYYGIKAGENGEEIIADKEVLILDSNQNITVYEYYLYNNNIFEPRHKYESDYDVDTLILWKSLKWDSEANIWETIKEMESREQSFMGLSCTGEKEYYWDETVKYFTKSYFKVSSLLKQVNSIPTQFAIVGEQYHYSLPDNLYTNRQDNSLEVNYGLTDKERYPWLAYDSVSNNFSAIPAIEEAGYYNVNYNAYASNSAPGSSSFVLFAVNALTQTEIQDHITKSISGDTTKIRISHELTYIQSMDTNSYVSGYPYGFIENDDSINFKTNNEDDYFTLNIIDNGKSYSGDYNFYVRFRNDKSGQTCIGFGLNIDEDKNVSLKKLTSIDNNNEVNNLVKVFPNPASDKVIVEADNIQSIAIFDMSGSMLKNKVYFANEKYKVLDISGLQTGIYILQAKAGGKIYSKKLIVR